MAQTKTEIASLLAVANTEPRHRFGQNFMIDQNLVRVVAAAGEIAAVDVVIEVGPGTGTLTEELLGSAAEKVIGVEIDRNLAAMLRQRFGDNSRFELIEGDALSSKHELNEQLSAAIAGAKGQGARLKLVANLPYNIASPLVIELLLAGVERLVFTVQKEVADRLRAGAGSDGYGPLTVMAQSLSDVELLRTLPPQAFWPAPKIQSGLVCMIRQDRLGANANEFGRFVQKVFSARRKTLRKGLTMAGFDAEPILSSLGFDGKKRPEEFSPAQLQQLFEVVRSSITPPAAI